MNFYKNKTVLVTGATGLIGNHIVDRLMSLENVKVIALARNEDKLKSGFKQYLNNPNFKYVVQDVSLNFSFGEKIDVIFHAAGPMEGKYINNYPVDVILPNIKGTLNCLELVKKQNNNCRLVLFSSVTVYGNWSDKDRTVTEIDTNYALDILDVPRACYSESKRMSEVIAHSYYRQYKTDVVIARFSTVYGNTRFIPDTAFFEFIKRAINRKDIILNGANFGRRDNIYIDDAVDGILLIGAKGISNEVYNVSSNGELGNFLGVDEIAEKIAQVSNEIFKDKYNSISVVSQFDKRLPGLKLDNTKLKKLGWKINTSFSDGIEKIIKEMASI